METKRNQVVARQRVEMARREAAVAEAEERVRVAEADYGPFMGTLLSERKEEEKELEEKEKEKENEKRRVRLGSERRDRLFARVLQDVTDRLPTVTSGKMGRCHGNRLLHFLRAVCAVVCERRRTGCQAGRCYGNQGSDLRCHGNEEEENQNAEARRRARPTTRQSGTARKPTFYYSIVIFYIIFFNNKLYIYFFFS